MTHSSHVRRFLFTGLIAWLLAAPAFAEDTWTADAVLTKSGLEKNTRYPDLIKVTVKKNGSPAPNDTPVLIEVISGDAKLEDAAGSLGTSVTAKTTGGDATATVELRDQSRAIFTVKVLNAADNTKTLKTAEPLIVTTGGFDSVAAKPCAKAPDGTRCRTEVTIYTGMVIDSFAAKELNKYFNPEAADDQKSSFIAGVDVAQYVGKDTWIYLETVNGVRSVDVDCTAAPDVEVCKGRNADKNAEFLYILRNARTLEAFIGARREFKIWPDANGRFYAKVQAGFLDVAGAGTDIVDNHIFLAGGYLSRDDRFGNSYIEVGFGKSDIFDSYENRRFKFDGFLTAPVGDSDTTKWFLQMTVDSDFRSGPDSIQIYIGLDFDMRQLSLKF